MDPECVFSTNQVMTDCEEDFSWILKTLENLLEKQVKKLGGMFLHSNTMKKKISWEVSPQDGLNEQKYMDDWLEFFNRMRRELQHLELKRKQIKLGILNEKISLIQMN